MAFPGIQQQRLFKFYQGLLKALTQQQRYCPADICRILLWVHCSDGPQACWCFRLRSLLAQISPFEQQTSMHIIGISFLTAAKVVSCPSDVSHLQVHMSTTSIGLCSVG